LPETFLYDNQYQIIDSNRYSFNRGDILVRPNWSWLPGSSFVKNGRRSGHVAVVFKSGKGSTIEEALKNTMVIEALLFDQQTHRFLFNKKDQIRETTAWVSFGDKFKGIRYRLRTNLSESELEKFLLFNYNELDQGYQLLSFKDKSTYSQNNRTFIANIKNHNWNCATLTWSSFEFATGKDIDGNGGIIIYPDDIIANPIFDKPGCRIRF
jgi:hypothetical protein